MKKFNYFTIIVFIIAIIFCACSNPFDQSILNLELDNGEEVLVNIFIGEEGAMPSARTTSPNESAVAGYQLTFSGGAHAPLNIIGSNQTQIFLGNGNWIISATAYKLGGEVGNSSDAIATGSIIVNISNGQINGGTVPPIVLKSIGTGNGALHYAINIDTGVTGIMSLWNINGNAKITGFGINGDINLSTAAVSGLASGNFILATGRYIAEVKLTNQAGNIAFKREVIDIWKDTFTTFKFEPSVFLDPSFILPNSKAVLCETTSTIGGSIIGIGNGSGLTEGDPKTYTCYPVNGTIDLLFRTDSLFSTASWVNNTGSNPNGIFPNDLLSSTSFNLSTNNVLWVKAVSEDRSETIYYKFIIIPPVNYGDFNISGTNLIGISFANGILSINNNGIYTIGMKDDVTNTTNQIVIASGVNANITLSNVDINARNDDNTCAFDMTGASVNLTLIGDNTLRSSGRRAGLQVPDGSNLVIMGESIGTLSATGGSYGAGIGGGVYGTGGNITISGSTVTATGGIYSGAGIGGGFYGAGGNITISGGTVTATGGFFDGAAGIGGGLYGAGGNINSITGNAVVFASSIQPDLPTGVKMGPAIVSIGSEGTMYGNVSLARNVMIPSDVILNINNDQTLTIESGYTLINNGAIILENNGKVVGTITGNQPIEPSFIISGSTGYTYTGGALIITGNGQYSIGMKTGITATKVERIKISTGVTADIILNNVNIDVSNYYLCAFDMTGATVNLTLIGDNVLRSGFNRAGLEAPIGSTLVISAVNKSSLIATAGRGRGFNTGGAAGIGGIGGISGGTITILSGVIIATGSEGSNNMNPEGGAGIGGGGDNGAGGTITILGGTVTATGLCGGAGIGGGGYGAGGTITISGGIVTAIGEARGGGAGIGGGCNGAGGTIIISGGTVIANGVNVDYGYSAGIGIGFNGSGGTNSINGNAVIFASSIFPNDPNVGPAIVFIGNNGTMYGNVTLQQNVTFPSGRVLAISGGQNLTIPSGITLTNNGTINNSGTINRFGIIDGNGSVVGNQPVW